VEEVARRTGGPRLFRGYPTVDNQRVVHLDDDIMDVVSANFSMGSANSENTGSASPFSLGALVYPMTQLDQASFMDAAAGFPSVGFGPPQAYMIFEDQGTAPSTTLPPPWQPQVGVVSSLVLASEFGQTLDTEGGVPLGVEPALTQTTVQIALTYVNPNGETVISEIVDVVVPAGSYIQIASPPGYTNANGWNVYANNDGGFLWLQNNSPLALGYPFYLSPMVGTTSRQPPATNTATGSGTGGALSMQLYPSAMIGQVNVYYRARPQLWADTSGSSWTNLDTSAQKAVIRYAIISVLYNRGRGDEAKQLWEPQYESMVTDLRASTQRRVMPKSGQVRDVANRSFPSSPWWLR
jgi:hypothetical protein